MGFPHNTLEFPYKRQSPSLRKKINFRSIDDVWKEIYRLFDRWEENKFSLGRNLYFHLPLFCNPKIIMDSEDIVLLKEYSWIQEFKIPIANTLDEMDSMKLDYLDLVSMEINSIKQYMVEKNG